MIAVLAWITFWMIGIGVTISVAHSVDQGPDGDEYWVYIFGWPVLLPVAIYTKFFEKKDK